MSGVGGIRAEYPDIIQIPLLPLKEPTNSLPSPNDVEAQQAPSASVKNTARGNTPTPHTTTSSRIWAELRSGDLNKPRDPKKDLRAFFRLLEKHEFKNAQRIYPAARLIEDSDGIQSFIREKLKNDPYLLKKCIENGIFSQEQVSKIAFKTIQVFLLTKGYATKDSIQEKLATAEYSIHPLRDLDDVKKIVILDVLGQKQEEAELMLFHAYLWSHQYAFAEVALRHLGGRAQDAAAELYEAYEIEHPRDAAILEGINWLISRGHLSHNIQEKAASLLFYDCCDKEQFSTAAQYLLYMSQESREELAEELFYEMLDQGTDASIGEAHKLLEDNILLDPNGDHSLSLLNCYLDATLTNPDMWIVAYEILVSDALMGHQGDAVVEFLRRASQLKGDDRLDIQEVLAPLAWYVVEHDLVDQCYGILKDEINDIISRRAVLHEVLSQPIMRSMPELSATGNGDMVGKLRETPVLSKALRNIVADYVTFQAPENELMPADHFLLRPLPLQRQSTPFNFERPLELGINYE